MIGDSFSCFVNYYFIGVGLKILLLKTPKSPIFFCALLLLFLQIILKMAGMYEIRSHALKSVESSPPFKITFSIILETFYNSF